MSVIWARQSRITWRGATLRPSAAACRKAPEALRRMLRMIVSARMIENM